MITSGYSCRLNHIYSAFVNMLNMGECVCINGSKPNCVEAPETGFRVRKCGGSSELQRGDQIVMPRIDINLVLKLRLIKLCVLAEFLAPGCFVVEVHELIRLALHSTWLILFFRTLRRRGWTYLRQGIACLCPSEPCVELFMEHPVLSF